SFRDATRVAGAASAIWTDIYISNRDALGTAVEEAIGSLQGIRDALADADANWLTAWNDRSAEDRRRLLEAQLAGGALFELRASTVAAMASEPVRIVNYLEAADTRATLAAVRELGAIVEERSDELLIRGVGLRHAQVPAARIEVGNAGTLMRLLPGWLAFQQ